jgi:general secretion pathway protein A
MRNNNRQLSDYLHQWGAKHVPFQDQPNQPLFHTEQTEKAIELLDQAASLRSVMLLSGPNGVGKSVLVAEWIKKLPTKAYLPVVATQATLSSSGLLWTLTAKFGRTPRFLRSSNLVELQEAIDGLGSTVPVVILDEAQNYTASAIEEVRMLLGLNLPAQPLFSLILIGDQYLIDTLRLQSRRPLYTRIAIAYQLAPLKPDQIGPYLEHTLKQAGIERECLEPEALQMLAAASDGMHRTLNLLARAAWIEASHQQHNMIASSHVQAALNIVPLAREMVLIDSNSRPLSGERAVGSGGTQPATV